MVRSKNKHCVTRPLARDAEDVLYLLHNYGPEVAHFKNKLNKRELDDFLALPWTQKVPAEALATYNQILGR
jgi:hypothetical protein